jgi:hypothetical protein
MKINLQSYPKILTVLLSNTQILLKNMSKGLAFVLMFTIFTIQIFDFLHLSYHIIEGSFNNMQTENSEHTQFQFNKCLSDTTFEKSHREDNCQVPNKIESYNLFDLINYQFEKDLNVKNNNSCLGHNQTHLFFSEFDSQINLKLDYACHLGHLVLKLNFVKEFDKYFDFTNNSKILKISTNFLDFPSNNFNAYSNKAPPLF